MANKIVIWGGTGNYKVVKEILEDRGEEVIALFDNNSGLVNPYPSVPFAGGKNEFAAWLKNVKSEKEFLRFLVTIGGSHGKDRLDIFNFLKEHGIKSCNAIHKTSFVSSSAIIGDGVMIFANSTVSTEAKLGECCIINTSASVDHECNIGDGVFIGPGARLAGLVSVGRYTDIYTGAVILPRIRIGEGAVVGAGAVVLRDVDPYTVVAGNPAKLIKK